jgi:pyruvate dehydrogenase E2 component (dihydrolipoamide acetyltransferase)
MAHSIVMPALEMAQESGKLIAWRKKEGESIAKGEPLLEVETDKAVVEVESPADGILAGIKAHEGDVIPVGQTIAWIVQPGEKPPAESQDTATGRRMETKTSAPAPVAAARTSVEPTPGAAARISPKARRLAREHGIDLARVRGTGGDGEILAEDILALVNAPPSSASAGGAGPTETMSQVARLMAERTTQSWTTAPHFFVTREVDAGALGAAREKFGPVIERERGVRLSHTDLLIAAVAHALEKHPRMNASWAGTGIRLNPEVNVGIAMAVDDGVVTAVISGAGKKSLGEIATLRHDLAERARAGKLRPADIAGATFTISNLGMYKVDSLDRKSVV